MNIKNKWFYFLLIFSGAISAKIDEKILQNLAESTTQINMLKQLDFKSGQEVDDVYQKVRSLARLLRGIIIEMEYIKRNFMEGFDRTATATEIDEIAQRINMLLATENSAFFTGFFYTQEGQPLKKQWSDLEVRATALRDGLQKKIEDEEKVLEAEKKVALNESIEIEKQKKRSKNIQEGKVYFQNIIIIIDDSEDPSDKHKGVMRNAFGIALCQQAAPIIVHRYTIFSFFDFHEENEYVKNLPWKNFDQWLNDNWLVYEDKEHANDFLLLIPKKFHEDQILGLSVKGRVPTDWSDIKKQHLLFKPMEAQHILQWILPHADVLWNVFITGHGLLQKKVVQRSGESLDEYKKRKEQERFITDLFAHRRFNDPFEVGAYDINIAGLPVIEFRKLLLGMDQKCQMNLLVYSTCYAGGYNLYLPYLTTLFVDNGHILSGVYGLRGATVPRFTIVAHSSTDAATYFDSSVVGACFKQDMNALERHQINYNTFFERSMKYAEKYLKEHTANKELQVVSYSDNELREMLLSIQGIAGGYKKLINMPQVKFPHSESFVYFPLDYDVFVITKTKALSASAQGRAIKVPYSIEDIKLSIDTGKHSFKTVAITPKYVGFATDFIPALEINTEDMPEMLSLLPGIALVKIKHFKSEEISLEKLIAKFFSGLDDFAFPKYYFMNEVVINNKDNENINISNIFIALTSLNKRNPFVIALFTDEFKGVHLIRFPGGEFKTFSIGKKVDSNNQSPEQIVEQYYTLLNDPDVAQAGWWKEHFMLQSPHDIQVIIKPLYDMIKKEITKK